MTSLSAFMGPLRLSTAERALLFNELVPWAVECGQQSTFLLNVDYEAKLLSEDVTVEALREELRLTATPPIPPLAGTASE